MNRLISRGRVWALILLLVILIVVYLVFMYRYQIVEGDKYYYQSSQLIEEKTVVTASRGDILDRYGRVLVTNKECYNLEIDSTKLFDSPDPNRTILNLVDTVQVYGDVYNDDLPITAAPPFEYTADMTEIQRTMLKAYLKDKDLPETTTAVELMSYMRTRYDIDNSYTAEEMRIIAGVRYSINVRYAIPTSDYMFVEDASMALITSILESKLAGINVTRAYVRDFNTDYAAHILGYVGLMTQEEFEQYSLYDYSVDATVGKDGVEYAFENYLHGTDGEMVETKNSSGTVLATVYTKEPKPGNNIYLTIDSVLQEQTERILDNGVSNMVKTRLQYKAEQESMNTWTYKDTGWQITGAAAVVVKVDTGEPLAIASWPSYDASTIIENYAQLLEEENAPLFNRALMGAYAPGSVFKPCTATAALTEGIINTEELIKCEGVFTKYAEAGYSPECWIWAEGYTHGELNIVGALLHSCNYFFYTVGDLLGIDLLDKYAAGYGLGEHTGIELVETTGNMSNKYNHADYTGTVWRQGDTLQAAIGQSDSIFTPLQLAEYCATVANGGTRHSASLLKEVRSYDFSEKLFERGNEVLSTIQTADYNWDAIHKGMYEVANNLGENEAVAQWFVDLLSSKRVAAKTGTAQKGESIINDAIFICYAPYEKPEIAVAIVVERGMAGSNCAPMARQIVDAYYTISSYSDSSESEMGLLK